jgi:hypothetical protein
VDEDGCPATQDAVPRAGHNRMDVHLRRGGLQPGSDAQSEGADCLKHLPEWIHRHFDVVNLLPKRSSAAPKPFSNSKKVA